MQRWCAMREFRDWCIGALGMLCVFTSIGVVALLLDALANKLVLAALSVFL